MDVDVYVDVHVYVYVWRDVERRLSKVKYVEACSCMYVVLRVHRTDEMHGVVLPE